VLRETTRLGLLLLLLIVAIPGGAAAQSPTPYRLADLVTGPAASGSSNPGAWVEAGEKTFFIADQHGVGPELWVTDGTAGGTRLLADTSPGGGTSTPVPLGVAGDRLLWWTSSFDAWSFHFSVGDLWASDGTPDGTVRLLPDDVAVPDVNVWPASFNLSGGVLRFAGCTPDGCALWRSDGTAGGTREIHPIPGEMGAQEVAFAGGRVFATVDGDLWTFDESGEATLLVDGEGGSAAPRELQTVGSTLFFIFDGDLHGNLTGDRLWASDGTLGGTRLVSGAPVGDRLGAFERAVGNRLYFQVGSDRFEIWRTEGTPGTTVQVTAEAIEPALDEPLGAGGIDILGQRIFLVANRDSTSLSPSLWVSDGTPETTRDLLPCTTEPCPWVVSTLTTAGGRVLFVVSSSDRLELWSSDGTAPGTGPASVLCQSDCMITERPSFFERGGEVAFALAGRVWLSDGTPAGTRAITDPEVSRAAYGGEVGRVGACWLYAGEDDRGSEPWCSEGTPESARIVRDLERSAPGSEPAEITAVGGLAVFSALAPDGVRQVWSSDGAAGSVQRLTDTPPPYSLDSRDLFGAGDFALFREPAAASRLWRTDGTENGTYPIGDLDWRVGDLVRLNGRVYAFGYVGLQYGIWEIDGSPQGLRLAVPLQTSQTGIVPFPVAVGDVFYFVGGQDGGLWRSDGTAAGTWKVLDVPADHRLPQPLAITEIGGFVYFVISASRSGQDAIWRTDGGPDSAEPFAPIPVFEGSIYPPDGGLHAYLGALYFVADQGTGAGIFRLSIDGDLGLLVSTSSFAPAGDAWFTELGDELFFTFDDAIHGRELWRTDGTPAGTRMLADLHSGGSSYPSQLTVAGDRLFFSAASERYGHELWEVDRSGTVRQVADIYPGPFGSGPLGLTVAGGTLFFSADDGVTGREPWALPLTAAGQPPLPPGPFLESPSVPGFRFKVRITGGGTSLMGRQEPQCIPETLCVSGQIPGRSEVFLRVVGPKPNGYLWPTLVKFSTLRPPRLPALSYPSRDGRACAPSEAGVSVGPKQKGRARTKSARRCTSVSPQLFSNRPATLKATRAAMTPTRRSARPPANFPSRRHILQAAARETRIRAR
jgi:ELWxxDGT repeat protein